MNRDRISKQEACTQLGIAKGTFEKYATAGYNGIVLETYRIGKRVYTTQDAIDAFETACTQVIRPLPAPPVIIQNRRLDLAISEATGYNFCFTSR